MSEQAHDVAALAADVDGAMSGLQLADDTTLFYTLEAIHELSHVLGGLFHEEVSDALTHIEGIDDNPGDLARVRGAIRRRAASPLRTLADRARLAVDQLVDPPRLGRDAPLEHGSEVNDIERAALEAERATQGLPLRAVDQARLAQVLGRCETPR